jgi:hypothetical protein
MYSFLTLRLGLTVSLPALGHVQTFARGVSELFLQELQESSEVGIRSPNPPKG